MTGGMRGRLVTAGALVAGLTSAGTGTAWASPGGDVIRWTGDYALTSLRLDGANVAFVNAFMPPQEGAAPTLDIWVEGFYHCTNDEPLTLSIDSLQSASVTGTTTLTCVWEPDPEDPQPAPGDVETLTGSATSDVSWAGTGDVRRVGRNGATDHCVGRSLLRSADVTGEVTVDIRGDELVFSAPSDSLLGHDRTVCPPPKL